MEEDRGPWRLRCGSAYKTRDCIVDALEARWEALEAPEKAAVQWLQSNMDNGPASQGRRTQFRHRMVQCAAQIATPMQRLYSPPDPSQYQPIERGWGIVALHWHGTKRIDVETMLEWAKRMPWQGRHPGVALSRQGYQKGMALGQRAMRAVAKRWVRHPQLPKWDILIRPASAL